MTAQELGVLVDNILEEDKGVEATPRIQQERKLFKDAILLQQLELNRTPSSFQISSAWKRWKRERFLEIGAESEVDSKSLYQRKK